MAVTLLLNLTDCPNKEITQNDVRLALANEDAENLQRDDNAPIHQDMTPGAFITVGLELETQQ